MLHRMSLPTTFKLKLPVGHSYKSILNLPLLRLRIALMAFQQFTLRKLFLSL